MRKILQLTVEPADLSDRDDGPKSHDAAPDPVGVITVRSKVAVIVTALLCALICALLVNYIIRSVLHYIQRSAIESAPVANAGLKKSQIRALPTVVYNRELSGREMGTDCPICLADFGDGEHVRVLPKCGHGFHIKCIDKWFLSHSSCPTCRQCLLDVLDKSEVRDSA